MPNIVSGNTNYSSFSGIDEKVNYTYPNGRDLKPGSKLHNELVQKVYNRAKESSSIVSKRFETWRKIDRSLTAFIPTKDAEALVKQKDERKPVAIVVPYSYATLETLLTYMSSAFLDAPIFKFDGVSSEDMVGCMLLEKVVDVQCTKAKASLALHTSFRDAFSYGLGVVAPSWETRWGKRTVVEPDGIMSSIFQKFINLGEKRVNKDAILYEGNVMRNIDPYLYLPDPNVPADSVQRGEYVGWIEQTNYMRLMDMEKDGETTFNVKYLKELNAGSGRSIFNKTTEDSGRNERLGSAQSNVLETRPIDVIWMYITIIPKEWKLGDGEYPEKWLFGLAADKYLIAASSMNLNHNMFPVGVCVPDSDGYSTSPVSRLEMVYGLQETLDWLFSSHMENVRKAINDMLIVDPSLININDLKDPAPGKLLRMRRAAWGRGVENAVKQLQVNDVTAQHIRDSGFVTDLMQKCTGSVDSIMGFQQRSGERVSASESNNTRSGALSRLAKSARLISLQMMQDLGYMAASHTQQLMNQELFVNIAGRSQDDLMKEYGVDRDAKIKVTPFDLCIDYDVFVRDGSIQGGEDANLWIQLFQTIGQNQELAMQYDTGRIFMHIARQLGAKDVQDFIKKQPPMQPSMIEDEKAQAELQAGNLISAAQLETERAKTAGAQAIAQASAEKANTQRAATQGQMIKNIMLTRGGEGGE